MGGIRLRTFFFPGKLDLQIQGVVYYLKPQEGTPLLLATSLRAPELEDELNVLGGVERV